MNRLFQQLIRDPYLTISQKCRDLVMQIFGHEALINQSDTANVAHCTTMNIDFYRLSTITSRHLAMRKLLNPFKWIEFLLIAPLELFVWLFQRSLTKIYQLAKKTQSASLFLFLKILILPTLIW